MRRHSTLFVLSGWAVVAFSAQGPVPIKVSTALVTRSEQLAPAPIRERNTNAEGGAMIRDSATLMQMAALQAALDRNGFGVGLVDGREGTKTSMALKDYARSQNLSISKARKELLADQEPATVTHILTAEDMGHVGTAPADWLEAAKVPAMACESLEEALSEQFHVSPVFLKHLNSSITNWQTVTVGTSLIVPNTRDSDWSITAARLEVDCGAFRVRAFNTNDVLIASFPCSIARKLNKVPSGDLTLVSFAPNPNYTFDPANFPESPRAQEISRKLIIPPGPNNPVGVYWLTLSATGFGMHGTPHPETIGRRESHGCFRLTNWDITTLASMVEEGTPVKVMNIMDERE
ncbi:MAG: L,D-transpeptidase family protein [bacterium]